MHAKTNHIIEKLQSINLSTYPIDEVKYLLKGICSYATIQTKIDKGKLITRARLNNYGEYFREKYQLSYKPQNLNTNYQRASTPNNTMFYGSIDAINNNVSFNDTARIIASLETSTILNNENIVNGKECITFGIWELINDIEMLAIYNFDDAINNSDIAKEMHIEYLKYISKFDKETQIISTNINNFIAKEFTKKVTNNDYEYIISSIYSEQVLMTFDKKINGIIYPSVKTDYHGYNVAITPDCVDKNLKLIGIVESNIIKEGINSQIIDKNYSTIK